MAYRVISRNPQRALHSLSKHLTKSFSTASTPQSFNLSTNPNQTQYRKHISLANLLQRYGFPSSQLTDFLTKNRFLLNSNVSELDQCLGTLLLSFKMQQNELVSMVFSCPSVLDLKFLRKWHVGIASFGLLGSGASKAVRSVLEFSRKFQTDPDEFSCCVEVLRGLGVSDGCICRVLEEFPGVVMINDHELKRRIEFWTLLGLDRGKVDKICSCFPRVLGLSLENRLEPLLNEFMDLGFRKNLVVREIVAEPRILSLELGELRRCLELLRKLRCREAVKEEIFSEGEFKAGLAVKLRIDCLCKYGLIRRDALSILKREPRVLTYDVEDIERKIEFLLHRMEFGIDSLIEVPEYLGVNFDKQIVPRFNVIEYLCSKGALGFEVGLRDIIKPSRLKFYNFYVKPYPECEDMYGRFSGYVETKARHPAGLWKLFKPPQHPNSKDEVRSIKSFTDSLV